MYVYRKSEPQLWTVGYFDPTGEWVSESDHDDTPAAASRCAFLNGGRTAGTAFDYVDPRAPEIRHGEQEAMVSALQMLRDFRDPPRGSTVAQLGRRIDDCIAMLSTILEGKTIEEENTESAAARESRLRGG